MFIQKSIVAVTLALSSAATTSAFAQQGQPEPCEQIKSACQSAGFIQGDAKQGKGLWMDCVNPIMQGKTAPHAVLAVPSVSPSLISACKAKRPKFGEGKVGS
jgi:hypothetical protein